jgi:STE24 endopeptidase
MALDPQFDPKQATDAYINSLGDSALAQAAAYTTGNHWLMLGGLIVSVIAAWLLIRSGVLVRVSNSLAQRSFFTRCFCICAAFIVLSSIVELPWSLYANWWRETQYGRTSQPLSDYLGQSGIALATNAILMGLFLTGVYALIRRMGKLWWLWSGGLTAGFFAALLLLGPIFIEPMFNDYQPIPEGEVKDAVEAMAVEANIPLDRIFMYDGSRQSNNFTANVSGIGASARIAISDVALDEASLDEVKAVTGHEVGHYMLGHVWDIVGALTVIVMVSFLLADRLFKPVARFFGADEDIGNPTGLPVLLVIVGLLMTLAQPLTNTLSRHNETEADQYSYATVNLPDAMASALVKTAEYRNPRPGKLEEVLFYTHPSVERRVRMAMEWKAANP